MLTFTLGAIALVLMAWLAVNNFVINPLIQQASVARAAAIELAANTYFELPESRRADFELKLLINQGLLVSTVRQELPLANLDAQYFSLLKSELENQFGEELVFLETDDHIWVNLPSPANVDLNLQLGFPSNLPYLTQQIVVLVVVVIAALLGVIASYLLVRRIATPIEKAVVATESFRGTSAFEPLVVEGPKELRSLAEALNQMALNVIELLDNRTALLAGISHDLRTPLTRMRLTVELNSDQLGEETTRRFTRDLEQLEVLLNNALEYAKGTQEQPELLPFHSFLVSLIDGIDSSIEIDWQGDREVELSLAPSAFGRVLANVIENGCTYGKNVSVLVYVGDSSIKIHILDQGPGIAQDEREKVFRPFYRLDSARGGVEFHSGLGLAIVKQLCDTYGWTISIDDRDGGGSDICIQLDMTITTENKH